MSYACKWSQVISWACRKLVACVKVVPCKSALRDFPQTKLDSEINSPFLLIEHGDPYFQAFAKNSLIKNIFEEENKFGS